MQDHANMQAGVAGRVPASLLRRFEVYLQPRAAMHATKMRSITAGHVGRLVKVKARRLGGRGV